MKLEGARRGYRNLKDDEVKIDTFVSDRKIGIA